MLDVLLVLTVACSSRCKSQLECKGRRLCPNGCSLASWGSTLALCPIQGQHMAKHPAEKDVAQSSHPWACSEPCVVSLQIPGQKVAEATPGEVPDAAQHPAVPSAEQDSPPRLCSVPGGDAGAEALPEALSPRWPEGLHGPICW